MTSSSRQRWFSHILDSGLTENIFGPDEVLSHVTPEIMANHRIQGSLERTEFSQERILHLAYGQQSDTERKTA